MQRARVKAFNKPLKKASNKGPAKRVAKAASGSPPAPGKRLCALPSRTVRPLGADVMANPSRARAILVSRLKWANGTVLHYCFFTKGHFAVPKKQADAIRAAFATWKAVGIGLQFKEVSKLSEAEVRIGYSAKDGVSQSSVGRDVLKDKPNEPTTTYGWDLPTDTGGTALHEIGHVLGMEHEHQNPYAGIKWHDKAVYKNLRGDPNYWKRADIFNNVLEKLSPQQVQGSKWDPKSIMEYDFEAGLIAEPKRYEATGLHPPGKLSAADKKWVRKWYPPIKAAPRALQASKPFVASVTAGKQIDFTIKPSASRKYAIKTKGASDATLVLFEMIDGTPRFVAGDDDSGKQRSAAITHKLFEGRHYIARLRMVHPGPTGKVSLTYS